MELRVSPHPLGYHYDRGIAEHLSHNLTLTLSIGIWEQKSQARKDSNDKATAERAWGCWEVSAEYL